jgi:hypothetical protein
MSDGSVYHTFDTSNTGAKFWILEYGAGPAGVFSFKVGDDGVCTFSGGIMARDDTWVFNSISSYGNIVEFAFGGTVTAKIDRGGKGIFEDGGFATKVVSTIPQGNISGSQGQILVYSSGGTYRLYVCVEGGPPKTWKYLTIS